MRWLIPFVAVLAAAGCSETDAVAGPRGPDGDPGDPGPGTRVVWAGTSISQQVDIRLPDGLGLDDPPVFQCYERGADFIVSAYQCAIVLEAASGEPVLRTANRNAPWQYRIVLVY